MRPLSKNIIIALIVFLALSAVFSTIEVGQNKPEEITLNVAVELIRQGRVERIIVQEDSVTVMGNDGTTSVIKKEAERSLEELLTNYGVTSGELSKLPIEVQEVGALAALGRTLLPSLIPILLLAVILWIMFRQLQGANARAMMFGQSSVREADQNKKEIAFADVAGVKEAKEELGEVVEFLKDQKKFAAVGAKIPKGVLLMGHPGTGKTLLARAVAGEAKVPFFHISGSEFVEMFVGVGASRVRDLFAKAKKQAPCIVFIDEIDAVGRRRGAGLGGGHDEREQTLNQILVEMDGFDPNIGVIVMAATNRPDVLDPALLRPGRFDRRVILDLPDLNDREAILNIHAKNKPMEPEVNLRRLAERTIGFSGADLANVLNEAAILAARRDKQKTSNSELFEAVEKVMLGPERKSHILSQKEREITAYHEGGHALVAHSLPYADPVHKISIISRGRAAGYTMKLPVEDRKLRGRAEFLDDLAVMLGGFVSEKMTFNDITTGASDDLRRATETARELITRYGMSEALGPRTFGNTEEMIFLGKEIHEQRDYSEKTAEKIDAEIQRLLNDAEKTAERVLSERRATLQAIAQTLLQKESLEKEEFEEVCSSTAPS